MKKLWILFVCLCGIVTLSGCSSDSPLVFDASGYVEGILMNVYYGDSSKYQEFVNVTEEEAKDEYESGIEVETNFLLDLYAIETVSDATKEQFNDFYKEIYQNAKFEVKDAKEVEEEVFKVDVVIQPMDIIMNSYDEMDKAFDEVLLNDYESDEELDEAIAVSILNVLKEKQASLGYLDAQTITVTISKGEEGLWSMSDEDFMNLDIAIIEYDE